MTTQSKTNPKSVGQPGSKNKIVAALLALFLGSFGIHKFYLREIGWGILYILFSWTGVPAVFSFVEGILYLVLSDESFDARFNKPDGSPPHFSWTHFLFFSLFVVVAALFQIFVFGLIIVGLLVALIGGTQHMGMGM